MDAIRSIAMLAVIAPRRHAALKNQRDIAAFVWSRVLGLVLNQ